MTRIRRRGVLFWLYTTWQYSTCGPKISTAAHLLSYLHLRTFELPMLETTDAIYKESVKDNLSHKVQTVRNCTALQCARRRQMRRTSVCTVIRPHAEIMTVAHTRAKFSLDAFAKKRLGIVQNNGKNKNSGDICATMSLKTSTDGGGNWREDGQTCRGCWFVLAPRSRRGPPAARSQLEPSFQPMRGAPPGPPPQGTSRPKLY
jgi:hypothetical protein